MKQIAESYGYNLVVHGSMNRDLDLIAIPWNDHCCFTKEQMMIKEFQKYLTGKEIIQNNGNIPYTTLPGNRHSYVIDLNRGDRSGEWVRFEDREYYLDISVVQTVMQTNPEYTTGMANLTKQLADKDKEIEALKKGRFKLPDDKQIIEIAILFNDGKINTKLYDMVGMCQFVIDRLYENGDISKASSKEQDQEDTGDPEAWSGGFADNN
jgi:hypothetical protein